MTAPNPILTHALAYSQRNWSVFPCRPGTKAPATPHGFYDATADAERVRRWWTAWPDANLAIRTGAASGLLVLDVDPRNGGDVTFQQLVTELGPLPATAPRAGTPRGGLHVYLGYPTGATIRSRAGALGRGIDIKGEGGYVVAPPSCVALADGTTGAYTWLVPPADDGTPPPPLPSAWLARILADERAHPPVADRIAEPIPEGRRHDTLVALAGKLRGGGLDVEAIAAALTAVNTTRCVPPLPDDEVAAIAASAGRWAPNPVLKAPARDETDDEASDDGDTQRRRPAADGAPRKSQSQADALAEIGRTAALFCDPRGTAYARLPVGDHHEVWPVRSKAFRRWLVGRYYAESKGKAPNAEALGAALLVLEAHAQFEGTPRPVYLRVAPDGHGGIYLDLGDAAWRAVHVTAHGWDVVNDPPVSFRRSPGMQALPVPERGGDLDELRPFVNVPDADAWALLKAWLVAAIVPTGPYPVLVILGEQGAAKSTLARIVRALIDPATPELRSDPRELRDLAIAAEQCWVLVFDNVSRIPPWLSDALCRLSTGGGWATRELWTDRDEALFDAMRPVILNGISEFVTRGDLLDRALQLSLPPIPERERRLEAEVWNAFTAARPRLFGGLLDRLVGALRLRAHVQLDRLPRMADFAVLAVAAERGRGEPARFMKAYAGARAETDVQAVEASAVGAALLGWLEAARLPWTGTAGELLTALTERAGEPVSRQQGWPKTPRGLRAELDRLAPALRRLGWSVTFTRTGHASARTVRIEYCGAQPSAPSAPSAHPSAPVEVPRTDGLGASDRSDRRHGAPVLARSGADHADDADGADGCAPQYSLGIGAAGAVEWEEFRI